MEFTLQKYTFIELLFYRYKWCRWWYGGFWVKLHEEGYDWVKFDKAQFKAMKFADHVTFSIEDYTK